MISMSNFDPHKTADAITYLCTSLSQTISKANYFFIRLFDQFILKGAKHKNM